MPEIWGSGQTGAVCVLPLQIAVDEPAASIPAPSVLAVCACGLKAAAVCTVRDRPLCDDHILRPDRQGPWHATMTAVLGSLRELAEREVVASIEGYEGPTDRVACAQCRMTSANTNVANLRSTPLPAPPADAWLAGTTPSLRQMVAGERA